MSQFRDGRGKFVRMRCVSATDRCGADAFPCPFCEPAPQLTKERRKRLNDRQAQENHDREASR